MARGTIITDTLKDGSKRYRTVIRVEQNGQKKQVWKTFAKKKNAEDYLDHNSTDVRDGTYREIKKATFGEYVKQWKETYLITGTIDDKGNLTAKRLKPSTIRGYRTIIDSYLIPEFEHLPLQAVDAGKIMALESKLLQRPKFSNKTVHNALTLLGRIFEDARKSGYLKVSPMVDVEKTGCSPESVGRKHWGHASLRETANDFAPLRAVPSETSWFLYGSKGFKQLPTRKGYGFRTFKAAEVALYHDVGALPEAEITHRFW